MTDFNIPRDGWGRPMLYPPDSPDRVGYKRPSKLAKALDNGDYLVPWKMHNGFRGLVNQPILYTRINSMVAAGKEWSNASGEWKHIVNKAEVAGGSEVAADRGTSIHDLCEASEIGWLDYDLVDESLVPVMESYESTILPEFDFIARECFVAADLRFEQAGRAWWLRAAGSVDRIVEFQGKRYVVDIKSGRDDEYRMGVCAQTFLYANSKLYRDPEVPQDVPGAEWEASTWHNGDEFKRPANPAERASLQCDTDIALMFLAPREHPWEWKVFEIPLAKGGEIIHVGELASKARYVKKFERVM